ncbi:MAG TPA: hypothetical protein VM388_00520 [Acidimicrobiales bacterium]|nr:hypothetical protein [Acidimicrobiales bacterium]
MLVVSRADKLHNARTMLLDHRTLGDAFWSRFNNVGRLPHGGRHRPTSCRGWWRPASRRASTR